MSLSKKYIETPFEVKTIEETGAFTGYAAVFNNVDSHKDIILPGACTKSIEESGGIWPILDSHWGEQLGWNAVASEDSTGLLVTGGLNMKVAKAVEKHALAQQAKKVGGKMGLSIGFYTKESSYNEETDIRTLMEIDIQEYSFVVFPSNTRAQVLSMKSILGDLGKQLKTSEITTDPRLLESLLREVGFSNSVSKKTASTAISLSHTDTKNLCEVDEIDQSELEELSLIMTLMEQKVELLKI